MLSLNIVKGTKVYPWCSQTWPVIDSFSGDALTISGEVIENYEFQIRQQSQLHTNLSNKSSTDVSTLRRAIRIKFLSAKNSAGQTLTYNQVAQQFQKYVKSTNEDINVTIGNNTLDIFAPSTVVADLRSRTEGVATPLHPGTRLTFITKGDNPFVDSVGINVDKSFDVDKKWEQKNVDVEEGMVNFALKYQALQARRDEATGESKREPQSDDDEWD